MKKKNIANLVNRYTYRVEWSEEDQAYIAHALELPSVKAHGPTAERALAEVKTPIRLALESLVEDGAKLPEPLGLQTFKGKIHVRATPQLHKDLTMRAAEAGVPLNQYILSKLAQ